MVDLIFGVFGAAMFTEPAVTDVEEVVGLVHKKGVYQVSGVGCQVPSAWLTPGTRYPKPVSLSPARIRRLC